MAGIALAAIYAPNDAIGSLFAPYDINIGNTPSGVFTAPVFAGFSFVVRAAQPMLDSGEALEVRIPHDLAIRLAPREKVTLLPTRVRVW